MPILRDPATAQEQPSLFALIGYFLRLGLTGFGGPIALANYMRKNLVDQYRWIGADDYDEGLAIATACPGPLAYQLGIYCGYVTRGAAGAVAVAIAFALPPFAIVCAIAALYVGYGSTWQLQALFAGVSPVVIALIVRSCWDLGKKTLKRDVLAIVFAAVACVITILLQRELTAIFLVAGAIGIFVFNRGKQPNTARAVSPKAGELRLRSFVPLFAAAFQTLRYRRFFGFSLKRVSWYLEAGSLLYRF